MHPKYSKMTKIVGTKNVSILKFVGFDQNSFFRLVQQFDSNFLYGPILDKDLFDWLFFFIYL